MLIDLSSWQERFSVVKAKKKKKAVSVVKEYARLEVTSKGHGAVFHFISQFPCV